jgi:hypothetical protein
MRHLDQMSSLLFSEDPKQKIDKILRYLMGQARARGGAVLEVRDRRLVPLATEDMDIEGLSAIRAWWARAKRTLRRGRGCQERRYALSPIMNDQELVGVLYLEEPRSFDEKDTDFLRALLGRAIAAATKELPAAVVDYLAGTSSASAEREQLWLTLEKNEWNIARAARLLGVTRRTIYLRLARYGIKRKKVPKTLKLAPVV